MLQFSCPLFKREACRFALVHLFIHLSIHLSLKIFIFFLTQASVSYGHISSFVGKLTYLYYNNFTVASGKDREIWLEGNCLRLCQVTALNSNQRAGFPRFYWKPLYDCFSCILYELIY